MFWFRGQKGINIIFHYFCRFYSTIVPQSYANVFFFINIGKKNDLSTNETNSIWVHLGQGYHTLWIKKLYCWATVQFKRIKFRCWGTEKAKSIEIQGGGDRFSVHFAVTFLDRWRTSFCLTTIIKIVNNNTKNKQTSGISGVRCN